VLAAGCGGGAGLNGVGEVVVGVARDETGGSTETGEVVGVLSWSHTEATGSSVLTSYTGTRRCSSPRPMLKRTGAWKVEIKGNAQD
jgi:hypothetical protein